MRPLTATALLFLSANADYISTSTTAGLGCTGATVSTTFKYLGCAAASGSGSFGAYTGVVCTNSSHGVLRTYANATCTGSGLGKDSPCPLAASPRRAL